MLSGNSVDGACSCWCSCFCSLRSRYYERTALRAKTEDTLHHGDLRWVRLPAITPVLPLRAVVVTVPPLISASSWTAPPGPRASRMHVREIRVGLGVVGSPEVPLELPLFRDVWDWRDLRVELPCSILLVYVADLFLAEGHHSDSVLYGEVVKWHVVKGMSCGSGSSARRRQRVGYLITVAPAPVPPIVRLPIPTRWSNSEVRRRVICSCSMRLEHGVGVPC